MKNPQNAHIKISLSSDNAVPNEIIKGEIWFSHSQVGGETFTLTAKITGLDAYEKELYTQTQQYSPNFPIHQSNFDFSSPETPGVYDVVATVWSDEAELESFNVKFLVTEKLI